MDDDRCFEDRCDIYHSTVTTSSGGVAQDSYPATADLSSQKCLLFWKTGRQSYLVGVALILINHLVKAYRVPVNKSAAATHAIAGIEPARCRSA